jgi:hypothetical protein
MFPLGIVGAHICVYWNCSGAGDILLCHLCIVSALKCDSWNELSWDEWR